ncbi:MAG: hypothetical protein QF632_06000 [Candidatus Woesearchaeota archaeon]|nr:hypothetical protein [Candidatus Woesearchaeota archaeon]MDP7457497.1 hypothetical protein [Candidatus Woesearchaeota archaeon]
MRKSIRNVLQKVALYTTLAGACIANLVNSADAGEWTDLKGNNIGSYKNEKECVDFMARYPLIKDENANPKSGISYIIMEIPPQDMKDNKKFLTNPEKFDLSDLTDTFRYASTQKARDSDEFKHMVDAAKGKEDDIYLIKIDFKKKDMTQIVDNNGKIMVSITGSRYRPTHSGRQRGF